MGMIIQMVGTGNAFAKKYDNNNALIEAGGYRLLLDCGITLPKALHQTGLTFNDLDAILISHIHGDHVGGLEELAFQMLFKYGRKPTLYIVDRIIEPLWEQTLRGGLTQGPLQTLDDFFEVRKLQAGQETQIAPGISVLPIETKHIVNKKSYSFLFNRNFFYSADMRFDGELLQRLVDEGVETIYHDCQLEIPAVVHAGIDELMTLPSGIQQKTWLMHYGDTMEQFVGKTGEMRFVEQLKRYEV
ncbi:MBL fold metallo-hydrolase [Paenibacillus harenae]|uniref:MBL fold metallo-hydrolase n=1 Tax=Paenibacillus harenae TaxID=306543 RepID=UPI0027D88CAC|nr:MBL fold metallo-hydrolase [Paenibacillus harenae]